MVWATWAALREAWNSIGFMPGISHIRRVDQCISISDAALRYGCDIDNSIAYNPGRSNPLFEIVEDSREIPPRGMIDALRYLSNIGYDIEERNSKGQTLLLFGATQLCSSVITVLKFLIGKGADLCAVDPYNCGALHFALRDSRGADAWAWGSLCTDACDHDSDHEWWAIWTFSTECEDYAEDYRNDGLTPAPSAIHDIQNNHLACDDGVQGHPCWTCGAKYLPTTNSTRSGSHSSRGRNSQYIDLDETHDDHEDEETNAEDEDKERNNGKNNPSEEDDKDNEDDEDDEGDEIIPEGYVLTYDYYGDALIVRDPLPILKTRLRVKLLTLLRGGCDPNVLDKDGYSPSDDARYHGLWPEWSWALEQSGHIYDARNDRWVRIGRV